MERWTFGLFSQGINPQGIGSIGMILNFAVTLAVTPFTTPPNRKVRAMVDSIREPEGLAPTVDIDQAPEH